MQLRNARFLFFSNTVFLQILVDLKYWSTSITSRAKLFWLSITSRPLLLVDLLYFLDGYFTKSFVLSNIFHKRLFEYFTVKMSTKNAIYVLKHLILFNLPLQNHATCKFDKWKKSSHLFSSRPLSKVDLLYKSGKFVQNFFKSRLVLEEIRYDKAHILCIYLRHSWILTELS